MITDINKQYFYLVATNKADQYHENSKGKPEEIVHRIGLMQSLSISNELEDK